MGLPQFPADAWWSWLGAAQVCMLASPLCFPAGPGAGGSLVGNFSDREKGQSAMVCPWVELQAVLFLQCDWGRVCSKTTFNHLGKASWAGVLLMVVCAKDKLTNYTVVRGLGPP